MSFILTEAATIGNGNAGRALGSPDKGRGISILLARLYGIKCTVLMLAGFYAGRF